MIKKKNCKLKLNITKKKNGKIFFFFSTIKINIK
jgi:hypothetical protein